MISDYIAIYALSGYSSISFLTDLHFMERQQQEISAKSSIKT